MSKKLILFYSYEGSTKKVAEYLSKELDIPCEQVRPIKDLKPKGITKYPIGGGQVILKRKPELMPIEEDLKGYDTILLGSPIWAGNFTPAIRTLLETGILKDKKIAFFYTSQGGPGKVERKKKEAANRNNQLISSYGLVNIAEDFEELKQGVLEWARSIE